jgi:hypothetical protein
MGQEENAIHRYTDLPALLYMLQRHKLTLLDPMSWDDANDSHFLMVYKQAKKLSCLCALCFSEADETYHHWRVFAGGAAGIRVTFRRARLLRLAAKVAEIRGQKVDYRLILDAKDDPPEVLQLPFLKRHPYQHEDEYRLIYESTTLPQQVVDIDLPFNAIRRITLSPWMNRKVADAVREVIKSIPGCEKLSVYRSTLIGNDDWMAFGDKALETYRRGSSPQSRATGRS